MNAFLNMVNRVDDRMNPIVVKELRQAMRGRMIPVMLIVYQVVLLLVMSVYLANEGTSAGASGGQSLLMSFNAVFLFAAMVLVPMSLAVRLGFERNDENTDLMFITTLPSVTIVRGKMLAGMQLTVLFFFATLPFMATTYMLRGVDFPMILSLLLISICMSLSALQFMLLVAVLPVTRAFKASLGLAGLATLIGFFTATISLTAEMIMRGRDIFDDWRIIASFLTIVFFVGMTLYQLTVALIKPHSANRAKPVRMWLTLIWLFGFLTATVMRSDDVLIFWMVFSMMTLAIALAVAVSEREMPGARVRRKIPRKSSLRTFWFPFYSGAPNGVTWCLGLFALTWLGVATSSSYSKAGTEELEILAGLIFQCVGYCLTAHYCYMTFLKHRVKKTFVWLIALIMLVVMTVGGWVVSFLFSPDNFSSISQNGIFHIFNPFVLANHTWRPVYLVVGALWCVVILVIKLPWLVKGRRNFLPLHPVAEEQ